MAKTLIVYEKEPECIGCVIGLWCDTKEQVKAAMEAGEERIHMMHDTYNDSMIFETGYRVFEIKGQV